MDERPPTMEADVRATPGRPARRRLGLSWKLLFLTVLFVMASAVLIYVPSVANFRLSWLADRLTMADTATVVLAASAASDLPRNIQDDLLKAVGATGIAIRNGSVSRLIATVEMPPTIDRIVDLRSMEPVMEIFDAFDTLVATEPRMLRVVGESHSGALIELVIGDAALRAAMLRYSVNILWLSALISIILSLLLYLSLNRMFVRPMRKLS
ncbi:MAG: sensor histidine kinase, partial [Bauldia sp.]|nr:sensor histidine kinase [Bauldia sp.]